MNLRQIKTAITMAFAFYMSLICFNNITDYSSNFEFVSNVAGMEQVSSLEHTGWRSVRSPVLHHLMYTLIILMELSIAVFLWIGTFRMYRQRNGDHAEFVHAKKAATRGLTLGVLLFLVFFLSIGGEWFLMWQSEKWNAQDTAFANCTVYFLALIFMNQNEK